MRQSILASVVLVLAAACSLTDPQAPHPPVSVSGEVHTLPSPAAPGSGEPNLSLGADGTPYLSWIEPLDDGHALRFAAWRDSSWTAPLTVAFGKNWFVNWADFPSVTANADGVLAAHWLAKSGEGTYAYDVMLATSSDGGRSWTAPVRPHADGTQTEHGFASLVPEADGSFAVVWLDGRETGGDERGAMTLRAARLHADGTVADERLIDKRVCDCCPTDAVATTDGTIVTVYRGRSAAEVRDILVSRRVGREWSVPETVHEDGWTIAGCPVNGPALAVDGDRIVAAWFTVAEDRGIVRAAISADGGRTFADPVRIDEGNGLGRVDTTFAGDGSILVSWLEQHGELAALQVRSVDRSGEPGPVRVVATTDVGRSSGFPQMLQANGRTLLAWTSTGEPSSVLTAWLDPPPAEP